MKTQSHLPSGRRQWCPICDFKGQGSDLWRHLVSADDSVMKEQKMPGPRLGRGRRVDAGRGDVVKLTGDALHSAYQDILGTQAQISKTADSPTHYRDGQCSRRPRDQGEAQIRHCFFGSYQSGG